MYLIDKQMLPFVKIDNAAGKDNCVAGYTQQNGEHSTTGDIAIEESVDYIGKESIDEFNNWGNNQQSVIEVRRKTAIVF